MAINAIPPQVARNLTDKLYERRKLGALEIENMIQECVKTGEGLKIIEIIASLRKEFIESTSMNARKGGLISMAAVALGLGDGAGNYVTQIVPPVLGCFKDPDHKVRYYACESLYNIVKVTRGKVLPFFNEVFDNLCQLAADPDKAVKNGAELLDRMVKEVVCKNRFDLEKFIPLLGKRVLLTSADCRRFIVSWIRVLDSIPEIDMIRWLPHFLDGLFQMLGDKNEDIKQSVETCLTEFLEEIKQVAARLEEEHKLREQNPEDHSTEYPQLVSESSIRSLVFNDSTPGTPVKKGRRQTPEKVSSDPDGSPDMTSEGSSAADTGISSPLTSTAVSIGSTGTTGASSVDEKTEGDAPGTKKATKIHFGSIIKILLSHSRSRDEFCSLTALSWLNEFILIGKDKILPLSSHMLGAILPQVSHKDQHIQTTSRAANNALIRLVKKTTEKIVMKDILTVVVRQFKNQWVPTRLCSVRWVNVLHMKDPNELQTYLDDLFPALLKLLSDPAEEIVRGVLQALARFSSNETYFQKLVVSLVELLRADRKLLEDRTGLIFRQLALHIKPERVYRELAHILENEQDAEFASRIIQIVNLILLTSTELLELRNELKSLSTPESQELFQILHKSWCFNESAVFSLCLLSQMYEHAAHLVLKFAEFEMTVETLMEIDRLVQLLESPIFMYLRLQLLEPDRYPFLFKALYGLLMLLPQTTAFETLKNRLSSVATLGVLQLIPKSHNVHKSPIEIDLESLLAHFCMIQQRNQQQRHSKELSITKAKAKEITAASNSVESPTPVKIEATKDVPKSKEQQPLQRKHEPQKQQEVVEAQSTKNETSEKDKVKEQEKKEVEVDQDLEPVTTSELLQEHKVEPQDDNEEQADSSERDNKEPDQEEEPEHLDKQSNEEYA